MLQNIKMSKLYRKRKEAKDNKKVADFYKEAIEKNENKVELLPTFILGNPGFYKEIDI